VESLPILANRELADKARLAWIARLDRSNRTMGGDFVVVNSGIREG
jgi:hypothetical protein